MFKYGLSQEPLDSLIVASIAVEKNENGITFLPIVQNKSELHKEYNYLLLVKKTDEKKNISVNKQAGKFTLTPKENKQLSSIHLNETAKINIKALLFIRDENVKKLIAADSLEINSIELSAPIKETNLMIQGMVVDDTKTKFGKDFYDAFFTSYNQIPQKFKFIISISEMPNRGQSSIIQIKADYDVIYEFVSKLDEEYINAQVAQTLKMLTKAEQSQNYSQFKY